MIDVCKLNTGEILQLIRHEETTAFAKCKWSLVGDLNKSPRKQNIWWVKSTAIAKKWSVK